MACKKQKSTVFHKKAHTHTPFWDQQEKPLEAGVTCDTSDRLVYFSKTLCQQRGDTTVFTSVFMGDWGHPCEVPSTRLALKDESTSGNHVVKCKVIKWAILHLPGSAFHLLTMSRFSLASTHTTCGKKKNHELRNPYRNQGNSNAVTDQTYWKMGAVCFCRLFILMGSVRASSNNCEALVSRWNRKWEPNHFLAGLHWGLNTGQYLWVKNRSIIFQGRLSCLNI